MGLTIFRGFFFCRGFSEIFHRFSEVSQRSSQRLISLSEALSPVSPNRVAP